MLASIALTTYALTHLAAPDGPGPRVRLRQSLGLLAQAVPVMIVLFLLFPRIDSPLWSLGRDEGSGVTGLSETMSPGSITRITESPEVAFRATFEQEPPPQPMRYWRGPVFWRFDGETWSVGEQVVEAAPRMQPQGATVSYTLVLEPHRKRWIFGLDMPVGAQSEADHVAAGAHLLADDTVTSVREYRLRSALQYRLEPEIAPQRRRRALRLPSAVAPRARELAGEWRRAADTPRDVVDQALAYFASHDFEYTLSPPGLGDAPVDQFLFDTRSGFCEHYASAFAVLMRAAGVPARVVTGYQGGEMNAAGDYMIVRQSDAHAWTEVWLAERGWVRVDPTTRVASERVDQGVASVTGADERLTGLSRNDAGWLRSAALLWDSVNYGWNRFVLGYGPDLQRRLLRRIGLAGWGRYALGVLAVLSASLILAAVWLLLQRPARPADRARRAWQVALRRLQRAGIRVESTEGPRSLSERVRAQRPDLAPGFTPIARLYMALRYREPAQRQALLEELEAAVRRFRPRR
ncbi:MAG: DUF3488 domain-containing protein [Proteobacteria bacterium SW_6_67_9]|nr:MAG: DUF3488 domain-containing protein [Proteobacteria bacterium SW_6_67_9]